MGVALAARRAARGGLDAARGRGRPGRRRPPRRPADGRQPRLRRWTPRRALAAAHPGPADALAADLAAAARALHARRGGPLRADGRATALPLLTRGARILTHCNAGALATGGYGTALGVVRAAFAADPTVRVVVRRDPAPAAGRPPDRLGARARGHPLHAHRRRHGRDDDGVGPRDPRRRRRRPHRRQRRRGEQDRHLRRWPSWRASTASRSSSRRRRRRSTRSTPAGAARRHRGAGGRRGARPGPLRPAGGARGRAAWPTRPSTSRPPAWSRRS